MYAWMGQKASRCRIEELNLDGNLVSDLAVKDQTGLLFCLDLHHNPPYSRKRQSKSMTWERQFDPTQRTSRCRIEELNLDGNLVSDLAVRDQPFSPSFQPMQTFQPIYSTFQPIYSTLRYASNLSAHLFDQRHLGAQSKSSTSTATSSPTSRSLDAPTSINV